MLTVSLNVDFPHLDMSSFYSVAQGLEYLNALFSKRKLLKETLKKNLPGKKVGPS
jgi:hypothetical protein